MRLNSELEAADVRGLQSEIGISRRGSWALLNEDSVTAYSDQGFGVSKVNEMLADPAVSSGWSIVRLIIESHLGTYYHPDDEIQEFVRTQLQRCDNYSGGIRALITAPLYGFSVIEKIWHVFDDGSWGYRRFNPLHPATVERGGFKTDKHGHVTAVRQRNSYGDQAVHQRAKVAHWAFNDVFEESPKGESLLRPAYRAYTAIRAILRLWHRALEQGPRPFVVWPVPREEVQCPIHKQQESAVQVATEILEQIEDRSGIAFEMDNTDMPLPTVLTNEHIDPTDFLNAIKYHESTIFRALLTPKMLVEESEYSSRAQATTQYRGAFLQSVRGIQKQLNETLINELVIPLIAVNYTDVDTPGHWESDPMESIERDTVALAIQRVSQAGYPFSRADYERIAEYFPEVLVDPAEIETEPAEDVAAGAQDNESDLAASSGREASAEELSPDIED